MTATAGSSGALTGTFNYTVTYVTPAGETDWYGSGSLIQVTVSAQQVNLANVPVSTNSTVTARNIYRATNSVLMPFQFQYVGTINDNTTTVYTDNNTSPGAFVPAVNTAIPGIVRTDGYGTFAPIGIISQAYGVAALANRTGYANTAIGGSALNANTSGYRNVAIGVDALLDNTTGYDNTAVGLHAMNANTIGHDNVAVGYTALFTQTGDTGVNASVAVGEGALLNTNVTGGAADVAVGYSAGANLTNAGYNTAIGYQAMLGGASSTGQYGTAVGYNSLVACTTCLEDTTFGYSAGSAITSGNHNIIIGDAAGTSNPTTGSSNILIGSSLQAIATGTANEVNIGGALMGYKVVTGISCTSGNGCGTGGATVGGNGTFYFTLTLGSGSPSSAITLTMPAAATDWSCDAKDRTTNLIGYQTNTTASTTAPALTFYTPLGVATAPTAADLVDVHCWMR
jgi:hypothetical protein